jgi:hypothetical protein
MTRDARRIIGHFNKHRRCFDLTEGGLGDDLLKIATDGCMECIEGQHAPDGTQWDDLSEAYAREKERTHPGKPMGVRDELMAQPEEVAGTPDVTPTLAAVTYGISDEARAEASYFINGNPAKNQPPRNFWGFTKESQQASKEKLDRRFKQMVG